MFAIYNILDFPSFPPIRSISNIHNPLFPRHLSSSEPFLGWDRRMAKKVVSMGGWICGVGLRTLETYRGCKTHDGGRGQWVVGVLEVYFHSALSSYPPYVHSSLLIPLASVSQAIYIGKVITTLIIKFCLYHGIQLSHLIRSIHYAPPKPPERIPQVRRLVTLIVASIFGTRCIPNHVFFGRCDANSKS